MIYTPRYKKYKKEWQFEFQKELVTVFENKNYINIDIFNRKEIEYFVDNFILDYLSRYKITFIASSKKIKQVETICEKNGCECEKKIISEVRGRGRKGGKILWTLKTLGYKFG